MDSLNDHDDVFFQTLLRCLEHPERRAQLQAALHLDGPELREAVRNAILVNRDGFMERLAAAIKAAQ